MSPFSQFLNERLKASALSQSELALKLGIDQGNLSKTLRGYRGTPTKAVLMRVIEIFNLDSKEAEKLLELAKHSTRTIRIPVRACPEGYQVAHRLNSKLGNLEAWQLHAIFAILNSPPMEANMT